MIHEYNMYVFASLNPAETFIISLSKSFSNLCGVRTEFTDFEAETFKVHLHCANGNFFFDLSRCSM